jgi:demethylmenaquinone methyltransferase/2-methoxy-6-polyprenyl-1,4-benzoquinol methylase
MESQIENDGPRAKAPRVREMFAEIAPRYDMLNHLLSFNIDKRWRRLTVKKLADALSRPGAAALDLCCGTADLSIELGRAAQTFGVDFCHPMLEIGLKKCHGEGLPIELIEGDALKVPMASESFDAVTIAFGLRNLESVEGGLKEMHRLLKEGGRAAILEFSRPRVPVFRSLFQFYFSRVLPRIGNRISGSSFAYQYLHDSVQTFPDQKTLAELMQSVGFSNVSYYNLFGGVAALHVGDK